MYNPNQPRDRGRFSFVNRDEVGVDFSTPTIHIDEDVQEVLSRLRAAGLKPLLVGGSVRDALIDPSIKPKDLDFEVYGGSPQDIAKALKPIGKVDTVGQSFGVLKMRTRGGTDLDLSVPRRDSRTGIGHRGFEVEFDKDMTVEEAAARRDFTINAMAYDPENGELIDPYGGAQDLERGVLRHVSPAFAEDPLRVMRGVQFASRFDMELDPETVELCRRLAPEAKTLPDERMRTEWEKFAAKGRNLESGWKALAATGWDRELGFDATKIKGVENLDRSKVDDANVALTALVARQHPGDSRAFVRRVLEGSKRQSQAWSVAEDTTPLPTTENEALAQARRPGTLRNRIAVEEALTGKESPSRAIAEAAGVMDAPHPRVLMGRHLVDEFPDRKQGPWMAHLLKEAEVAQDAGEFTDERGALNWLRSRTFEE